MQTSRLSNCSCSRLASQSGAAAGWKKLSITASRKGYAGYEWDACTTTWHVRHRVLDSESGKWTRMDPLGYVDGVSMYQYAKSSMSVIDPSGLSCDIDVLGDSAIHGSISTDVTWVGKDDNGTKHHNRLGFRLSTTASMRKTSADEIRLTMRSTAIVAYQDVYFTGLYPGGITQSFSTSHTFTTEYYYRCSQQRGIYRHSHTPEHSTVREHSAGGWDLVLIDNSGYQYKGKKVMSFATSIQHDDNLREIFSYPPNFYASEVLPISSGIFSIHGTVQEFGIGWQPSIGIPGIEWWLQPDAGHDLPNTIATLHVTNAFEDVFGNRASLSMICKCHS